MVVKAVILDFGGTLAEGYIDWDEYNKAIHRLLKGKGFSVDFPQLLDVFSDAMVRQRQIRAKGKELTIEEFYAFMLEELGITADRETLKVIHDLFRRHFKTTLIPCVEEVLKKLSASYKLALLSNTWSDLPRRVLKQTGLIGYFDIVICSRDLGMSKPNPQIFHYILEELGVRPEEAVHVGDSMKDDIEGASKAGIRAIWIRRTRPPIVGPGESMKVIRTMHGTEPEVPDWTGPTIKNICELPQLLPQVGGSDV